MKRLSKKQKRKVYLKAAELYEKSLVDFKTSIKTYDGTLCLVEDLCGFHVLGTIVKASNNGYYKNIDQLQELFPEYFLLEPVSYSFSWWISHSERITALLLCAEMCN